MFYILQGEDPTLYGSIEQNKMNYELHNKKVPSFFTWNFYPFCYPLILCGIRFNFFFQKVRVITPQLCTEKSIKHITNIVIPKYIVPLLPA